MLRRAGGGGKGRGGRGVSHDKLAHHQEVITIALVKYYATV